MRVLILISSLMLSMSVAAELTIEQLIDESRLEEGSVASRDLPGWSSSATIVVPQNLVAALESQFPTTRFLGASSASEAAQLAVDAQAVLRFCSQEVVEAAKNLVWMQIYSAGAESCLRVERIGNGDVLLTNMQKMTSPAIGEHAIAMALALGRQLVTYTQHMEEGSWDREPSADIVSVEGRVMLVVGLGGIGREVARRAHGLGMRVMATRNSSRNGPDYVEYVGLSDELLELAAKADVIVNALPLTPETEGLFDKAFFDAAKPGHIFVNVARGGSVVTDDLMAALEDGRVKAAGLDVTDPEPLPSDHPLWSMPNVIITPHIAWAGFNPVRQELLVVENIRRYVAGEPLLNVVDPQLGY
jgi:phosphoglycerate dehydrogenase-like enzyme